MVVAAPSHASMQQWCAVMEAAVAAAAGVAVESLDHGLARKRTAAEQAAVKEQVAARARELVPGGLQGGGGDVGALSAAATAGSGAQAALPGVPPSSSSSVSTGGGGTSGTPAPGGEPAAAQEQVGAPMLSVCRCVAEVKELSLSIDESRFTKVRGLRLHWRGRGRRLHLSHARARARSHRSQRRLPAHCPRPCSRLPAPRQVGVQPPQP